jgi:transposase
LKLYQFQKNVQMVLRLKVIIAYENGMPENKIHIYADVSKKSTDRWIKDYLKSLIEALKDKDRSRRPPKIAKDKLEEIGEILKKDNQRIWVARHICFLIIRWSSSIRLYENNRAYVRSITLQKYYSMVIFPGYVAA